MLYSGYSTNSTIVSDHDVVCGLFSEIISLGWELIPRRRYCCCRAHMHTAILVEGTMCTHVHTLRDSLSTNAHQFRAETVQKKSNGSFEIHFVPRARIRAPKLFFFHSRRPDRPPTRESHLPLHSQLNGVATVPTSSRRKYPPGTKTSTEYQLAY
jgi:hypothetical protein